MRQVISRIEQVNEAELLILKKRVRFATIALLAFAAIIGIRLWYLQIIKGDDFFKSSENNRLRLHWVNAPRGMIADRLGRPLIANRPYFNVTLAREDAPNPAQVLSRLSTLLAVDVNDLLDRIREAEDYPRYVPITLKEDLDWKTLVAVENHLYDLPGIRVEVQASREYLYENLGSHLFGYLGRINEKELNEFEGEYHLNDQIGKLGLERIYETELRGEPGRRYVEVDAQGFEQREVSVLQPLPGADIKLTIDRDLQEVAEEVLDGRAGAAVMMEVNTGRLLAVVSSPPLELNEFVGGISRKAWKDMLENPLKPFINKPIQGQYPPGSTYKMSVALAGLSEGVVTNDTTFYCNGAMRFRGRNYRCWKKNGHGAVSLERALAESCDVYFYSVGMKVGVDKLAEYAKSLGLGEPTGVNLEHEKAGIIPSIAWKKKRYGQPWHEGETMSISIGQGYDSATPLQICQMTSTLVNGGIRYRPQLIEEIVDSDGKVLKTFEPIVDGHALGNAKSLDLIRKGMESAVNTPRGTSTVAKLPTILVGAKTGTAQVVRVEQYKHLKEEDIPYKYRDHAWFTCYAPAEKPEIAITVIVEHGLHGATGAGPVARKLLDYYFKEVKPRKKDTENDHVAI
ncbi:MAG: penicillin-binding protein 2 [Proteobacteria bacterium]|nr:penicillin-binding protein 2 [Desulfobulbaceae bacterium]MBU4152735.1 penicillin-binding protein 2 [Pseudomonadota bacterium]